MYPCSTPICAATLKSTLKPVETALKGNDDGQPWLTPCATWKIPHDPPSGSLVVSYSRSPWVGVRVSSPVIGSGEERLANLHWSQLLSLTAIAFRRSLKL